MARRRRGSRSRSVGWGILLVVGGGAIWTFVGRDETEPATPPPPGPVSLLAEHANTPPHDAGRSADKADRSASREDRGGSTPPESGPLCGSLLTAGRTALDRGELIAARTQLSKALRCDLPPAERDRLRADLTELGARTIFGRSIVQGDPLVASHVIQPGETLGRIARQYRVTADFLARINGLSDKNRIRAGQRLKVVRGPFRCTVTKADYSLDVYVQDTFVKRFPVGIGMDGSTPTGTWRIRDKLSNPQYYPPRGGRIISADDPENPLGERWIGLEGVEGEAAGQQRYGIHGTIDPDSIGKSVSLGCIRMHNEDVEELYDLLVVGKSEVTVR